MERTLIIITPCAITSTAKIIQQLLASGYRITYLRQQTGTQHQWLETYTHLPQPDREYKAAARQGKPIIVIRVEGENAIEGAKKLLGDNNQEDLHISDSLDAYLREWDIWYCPEPGWSSDIKELKAYFPS